MKRFVWTVVLGLTCTVTLAAQWAPFRTPGVPRDAQGRVRMDAPPPRGAAGRPDLSGLWMRADPEPLPAEIAKIVGNREGDAIPVDRATAPFPPDPKSPPIATFFELGANVPGGLPFTPWAAALRTTRMATDSRDNPDANCLPMGITQFHMQPQPRRIVQTPAVVLIIYEANYGLRQIFTDGRALPKQGEPQPFWYGYSVGRWQGDELIVETNNVRGAESGPFDGWLDVHGSPFSDAATFVERFRRPIAGKLEIDVTVEDAKSYTRPFTVRINQRLLPDEELIEFVCNENQQFRKRIKVD